MINFKQQRNQKSVDGGNVDDVVSGNNMHRGARAHPSIGKMSLKRNRKECWLIEGWNARTSYRFNILHLPEQGLIRLRLYEGATLVLDSGNIIDTGADRLSSGKLGVYCDSQENISWSALRYRWTWCSAFIYKHIPKYLPPLDLKVLIKHICTTSNTFTYDNNTYNLFFFCDQSAILCLRIKL